MRHKGLLTSVVLLLLSFEAYCDTVPYDKAIAIARDFMHRIEPSTKSSVPETFSLVDVVLKDGSQAPCYLLNRSGSGFVIVSSEDCLQPVLAYSTSSSIDPANIPDAMMDWMDALRVSVSNIQAMGGSSQSSEARTVSSLQSVRQVKLNTAAWNQSAPYNNLCPTVNGTKSPSGCGPTALSIIMKYHEWPSRGRGTVPGYQYILRDEYRGPYTFTKDYDWANMLDKYSSGYSKIQGDAVAQLMYEAGYVLKAEYGQYETVIKTHSSFRPELLKRIIEHLDYDHSIIWIEGNNYAFNEIMTLIREDIDNGLPILVSGKESVSSYNGHMYVIDGYDSNDFVSINYGWGGSLNGYYCINPLFMESYNKYNEYLYDMGFIFHIMPNHGGDAKSIVSAQSEDAYIYIRDRDFATGKSFTIDGIRLCNASSIASFSGDIAVAVVDSADRIKEIAGRLNDIVDIESVRSISCVVNTTLKNGDKIKLLYRQKGGNDWRFVLYNKDTAVGEIPLKDENTLEEATWIEYGKNVTAPNGQSRVLIIHSFDHYMKHDWYSPSQHGYKLFDADGKEVSPVGDNGRSHGNHGNDYSKTYIYLDTLAPGKYTMTIGRGLETFTFDFIL